MAEQFNKAQRIVLDKYASGEYAHITTLDEVREVQDGLFTFLMLELADKDCEDLDEAFRRVENAAEQLQSLLCVMIMEP